MSKLNQVIAIESGVKTRTTAQISELYKTVQHPNLFEGFTKLYKPLNEEGEKFPPESKNVQITASIAIDRAKQVLSELFDVTAQKDFANCSAKASVAVDGQVLLTDVPVPYLLFLEKQLTDLHSFVSKLPTLDPSQVWVEDKNTGLHRTEPSQTVRTKKVQKALVLHPPTVEHPAQTQLITEDQTVGYWDQTHFSGSVPHPERVRLARRIETLQQAVKFAREEANSVAAPRQDVSAKVFGWIFA